MNRHTRLAVALLLGGLLAVPARPQSGLSAELSGRILVTPPEGQKASLAGTVVWLPGVAGDAPASAAATVASQNKRFEPHVLAVRRGTSVAFPNVDAIYHNAFSLSPSNPFDLGLYRKGAARSVKFGATGLVRIYCNIHPEMAAYVVVVDGDLLAVTDDDGNYRIRGIPPGRHSVQLWSEMAGEKSQVLDFPAGASLSFGPTLDASQYRAAPHKNKFGKDYPPATKDADRY